MILPRFKKSPRKRHSAVTLRGILPISFAVIFGALGAYLLITTHAATTEQPSVSWKSASSELLNNNADLCLGTPGTAEPAVGATVVVESCSTTNSEKWTFTWETTTAKTTTIVNGYRQCLDDRGGNAGVGTTVKVYTCTANDTAQAWATGYGDGTIRIDSLCLGVTGNSRSAGADVILTPCNTPVPSVHLTSPTSGSTVSGTTTVAASSSISQDSIAKITLEVDSTVLKTCMNASSCSASWNTTTVGNGSYTLTAVATGALGGTATATETIKTSNATPTPVGSGSGSGASNSGGGGGSNSTTGNGGGNSSASTDTTDSGTFTCDPSDPTCSDSTVSVCDPSDPTCSGGTGLCDPSDPTCSSSTSTDTTNGSTSDGSSTGSTSQGSSQSSNGSAAQKLNSSNTSKGILGVVFSVLAFAIVGFLAFVYLRRRKQASSQPLYDSSEFFAQMTPPATEVTEYQPTATPPSEIPNVTHAAANVSLPTEDDAHTEARLRWWDANAGQQPEQPANHGREIDEPPDMFEEGRKRLDEEDRQQGRFKS